VSTTSESLPDAVLPAAALMLRIAGRQGPTFALDAAAENSLGRAADADIVVADRLASRKHAAVRFDPAARRWMVRDLGSRNGTWVDGRRITSSPLDDGSSLRIGTSELVFRLAPAAAVPSAPEDEGHVVRCGPVAHLEGSVLRRSSAGSTDDARRPLLLYQASIRLLTARSQREVIATTIELAAEHCGAAGVGWFRVHDEQRLEPVCVVPPGSPLTDLLGESTRRLVAREGNAVWVARSPGERGTEVDLACVPLVEGDRVHAALATMAARGAMRSADFDFLVALASLAAAACAGHAEPAIVRIDGRKTTAEAGDRDLASLQTVDLDFHLAAPDEPEGTIVLDAATAAALSIDHIDVPPSAASPVGTRIESFVAETVTLRLDEWQRLLVIEALRRTGGSLQSAAGELGISRPALHRQLEKYGLVTRKP
jgi:pSer/pThr/pTyr-binding forkhead associated (FHA) protein